MLQLILSIAAIAGAVADPPAAPEPQPRPAAQQPQAPVGRIIEIPASTDVLPGVVAPRRSVTLGVSFDAQVLLVMVEEGQRVRAGEVIARLDDRAARASMALAKQEADQRARIERARLTLLRAQRVLERVSSAESQGAATPEELTDALTDVALAQTEMAEARELQAAAALRLEQASVHVERHLIRAPFEGAVVRLAVEAGAIVKSGDPVAEMIQPDRLSVDLFLPATAAVRVQPGGVYAVRLHAPTDRVVWATARAVEPRIEPTSATVRATFDFDLPPGAIRAGTLAAPADRAPNDEELAFMRGAAAQPRLAIEPDAP